jgi:hypothetical protein
VAAELWRRVKSSGGFGVEARAKTVWEGPTRGLPRRVLTSERRPPPASRFLAREAPKRPPGPSGPCPGRRGSGGGTGAFVLRLRQRRPHHRQDARPDRRGEVRPCFDHCREIGVCGAEVVNSVVNRS